MAVIDPTVIDSISFSIVAVFSISAIYFYRTRAKRFLCKYNAIYDSGRLRVPAFHISIWVLILFTCLVLISIILSALINGLLIHPSKTLINAGITLIVVGIFFMGVWMLEKAVIELWNIGMKKIFYSISQHIEITCEKKSFSDKVKSIFMQIESLEDTEKKEFIGGIHAVIRKIQT